MKPIKNLFCVNLKEFFWVGLTLLFFPQISLGSQLPITSLTALPGSSDGSIQLSWIEPATSSVSGYVVKYRAIDPIVDQTDWDESIRIDSPPLNWPQPSFGSSSTLTTFDVHGLPAGGLFAFNIRWLDQSFSLSPLSNNATAQAAAPCTAGANDGEGTANVVPASLPTGEITLSTLTFTIGSNNINTGGKIAVRIPDSLAPPQTNTPGFEGYISTASNNGSASLSLATSGQLVIVTVSSGTLNNGEMVDIPILAFTCDNVPSVQFDFFSQQGTCGDLVEIGSQPSAVTLQSGSPRFVVTNTYEQYLQANTITPVNLLVVDGCFNSVAATAAFNVDISADFDDPSTGFGLDPNASISLSNTFSSAFSSGTVPFGISDTVQTIYYRLDTTANQFDHYLNLQYFTHEFSQARMVPLSGSGITNLSVDTGDTSGTAQSNVTITPDFDGSDDSVFINFTLPDQLPYQVLISSDGFHTIVTHLFGFGSSARLNWDGWMDIRPGIAPPETYTLKVLIDGGNFVDTSLSVTVSANGASGTVFETGGSVPISEANVDIFGPTGHFTRTGTDGTFQVYGLRDGQQYFIRVDKPGFTPHEASFTSINGVVSLSSIILNPASIFQIHATRPSSGFLPEIWGDIRAHNSNWSKQSFATLHFNEGSLTSDAGDFYNTVLSSYSTLNLAPGETYTVEFDIPNYSFSDITNFSLAVGVSSQTTIVLSKAANIEGNVTLPTGGNPTHGSGIWVSVEACLNTCSTFDPNNRHYGGVWLGPGELSGLYRIFGVPAGTYELNAFAPGFVVAQANTTVSGTTDSTGVDFPTFSTGGSITGTITVNGDSTAIDSLDGQSDGFIKVHLHAESQTSFVNSFTEVTLAADLTSASTSYTISGLTDGTYNIFTHLQGFELVPPGPKRATVSSGLGNLNLTFLANSGTLVGTISLPSGSADYSNVELTLSPHHDPSQELTPSSISGGAYSFIGLGTGFHTLQAYYSTTGIFIEKNLQIVNGSQTTLNLNLAGNTYSVSGRVTTSAGSPYNSLSYIVNQTTPTTFFNEATASTITIPANFIMAKRILEGDHDQGPNSGPPDSNSGANSSSGNNTIFPTFDPRTTFFGNYNATTGSYTISNLSPGIYQLFNNGQMDGNLDNGVEIAEIKKFAAVFNSNLTSQNFTLSNGFDVSGTLRAVNSDSSDDRYFDIILRNKNGEEVTDRDRVRLKSGSPDPTFTLKRIPPGNYILTAEDQGTAQGNQSQRKKYSSKEVSVIVKASNVSNKEIELIKAAKIRGQLRIKNSGVLLTSVNIDQHLPQQFFIEARANPWFQGGFHQAERFNNGSLVDSDGKFTIIANPGTFDVIFRTFGFVGEDAVAKGKKQLVPETVSGVTVTSGETKDIGVIDLIEGKTITGTVTDSDGNPLANILVEAEPAEHERDFEPLEAFTNEQGSYTIHGIDPGDSDRQGVRNYFVFASPRPDERDIFEGFEGSRYAEKRKYIDTQVKRTGIDFVLVEALGSISGKVGIPPGGHPLVSPFDDEEFPGAEVILNPEGNIPLDNPIGDIVERTNPEGAFNVQGLAPGNYTLTALAGGYGSVVKKNILVSDNAVDIGTITMVTGHKLFGTLSKTDGSLLNTKEVNVIVGARNSFEDIIVGSFESDSSGNILSYTMSGFKSNKAYSILAFNDEDDVFLLASNLTLTDDTEKDFTLKEKPPDIFAQAFKETNGDITLKFEFTRPLRKSDIDIAGVSGTPDDNEWALRFLKTTGSGTLDANDSNWLSSNRKRALLTYTPGSGETSFVITSSITFNSIDPDTGLNHTRQKTFTFFLGIGNQKSNRILNASAGQVGLDDSSQFVTQAGTFGTQSDLEIEVIFRSASAVNSFSSASAGSMKPNALVVAKSLGFKAYPKEMSSAMMKALSTDIDPFSSFYDIFLPATVNHFFPQGKEAQLCLTYSTTSAQPDPHSLNVYYYNSTTNEYLLEQQNKRVDTSNSRICVDISHASVFTVLNSSVSIVSGSSYTGPLSIINFPNPFNLKSKTITLQNPGSASASQSISGTMIKMSIPSDISGAVEIEIFNVLGEKVRTLNTTISSGGAHFYLEWDGRNGSGKKVASGTYIGRFTIGGGNEKFFKMAVLK